MPPGTGSKTSGDRAANPDGNRPATRVGIAFEPAADPVPAAGSAAGRLVCDLARAWSQTGRRMVTDRSAPGRRPVGA